MSVLNKIKLVNFPQQHYVKSETNKTQVYLHHTVSGPGIHGDINHWLSNANRIATSIIIDHEGIPHQCFSSKYWAYHLGITGNVFRKYKLAYKLLDEISIGVEIDSWGPLMKHNNKFYPVTWNSNKKQYVPWIAAGEVKNVAEYPNNYRGFKYYEKYTLEQINTLRDLLIEWNKRWSIPLTYNEDMWDVCVEALKGTPGIYSHTSVRDDKSDIHPQLELVNMLKSLTQKPYNIGTFPFPQV